MKGRFSGGSFKKDFDIVVFNYKKPEKEDSPINMDVGIEGVLAVSLNFPKSIYSLKDVIEGSIKFSLVKLRIKSMSLTIIRKEVLGSGLNSKTNEETLSNYEIMDGCPAKSKTFYLAKFKWRASQ